MKRAIFFVFVYTCVVISTAMSQQQSGTPAPKPLYRDPVYDGAALAAFGYNNGEITCDRNQPVNIHLAPPK